MCLYPFPYRKNVSWKDTNIPTKLQTTLCEIYDEDYIIEEKKEVFLTLGDWDRITFSVFNLFTWNLALSRSDFLQKVLIIFKSTLC